MGIYSKILKYKKEKKKLFSVLIDPDKQSEKTLIDTIKHVNKAKVDLLLIGGSLLKKDCLEQSILTIKENSKIPLLLFPGNTMQLSNKADGILLLSLISGRNPEMLIGNHVIAAPFLKKSNLEVLSTGYMLIESGKITSASYMSNTVPIPYDKNDIAVSTATAGEMLGLKMIYMDAGSGAKNSIDNEMIRAVSESINIPLIIGGGIKSAKQVKEKFEAGADIIVVGNCLEGNLSLVNNISEITK